uniref:GDT1 family protein n=1 Tax=Peronospora matthiolae TaxID=2874970 RepID=A0AAV1U706_9STRA
MMARVILVLATLSLVVAPTLSQESATSDATDVAAPAPVPVSAPAPTLAPVVPTPAFDRADTNHNGVVDHTEFTAFTTALSHALDPFLNAGPISKSNKNNDNDAKNDDDAAKNDDKEDENDDNEDENDDKEDNHEADGAGAGAPGGWQNVLLTRPRFKLQPGGPKQLFWSGFVSGLLTIWATEIGDKTFFIAAILSMKKDRVVVFAGAIGALIVMTVLSVVMGVVATKFLPPSVTHYLGAVLFVLFGAKMLYDAREMNAAGPSDELIEVEEELMGKKDEGGLSAKQVEEGVVKADISTDGMIQVFSQTFLMTFLAEWGDRSQIATVTLSATKDAFGVTLGAILGHSMCTGIAVLGGKFLAKRISERTVTLVGGVLFVLFALHSFVTGPSVAK